MPPAENMTVFGDAADWFDGRVDQSIQALDAWVESSGYSTGAMAGASLTIAFMRVAQGFVDVGRLGNGSRDGGWGYGEDAMRALVIGGPLLRVIGPSARLLRVANTAAPTRQGAALNCVFVSATNAARSSRFRWFVTSRELAMRAGVNTKSIATSGASSTEVVKTLSALRNLGVRVTRLPRMSLEKLWSSISQRGGGVFQIFVEYSHGGQVFGHALMAVARGGTVQLVDTTGRVFGSLSQFRLVYQNARLRFAYHYADSTLMKATRAVEQAAAARGPAATTMSGGAATAQVVKSSEDIGIENFMDSLEMITIPVVLGDDINPGTTQGLRSVAPTRAPQSGLVGAQRGERHTP